MYCPNCGTQNDENAKFCASCGERIILQDSNQISPNQVIRLKYAAPWKRLVAFLIDSITILIIIIINAYVYMSWGMKEQNFFTERELVIIFLAIGIVIHWIYFSAMESSTKQSTLGKMALGLIVTDIEGKRINFWKATGRYFIFLIVESLTFNIGLIIAFFTAKKQTLHDLLVGTIVIAKK